MPTGMLHTPVEPPLTTKLVKSNIVDPPLELLLHTGKAFDSTAVGETSNTNDSGTSEDKHPFASVNCAYTVAVPLE